MKRNDSGLVWVFRAADGTEQAFASYAAYRRHADTHPRAPAPAPAPWPFHDPRAEEPRC